MNLLNFVLVLVLVLDSNPIIPKEATMGFDHEKLDVYRLSLQFVAWATPLLIRVHDHHGRLVREVVDHLDRASLSILLNIAEGNGKRQRQVRVRFFDDARGSATECAACLDALVVKGVCVEDEMQSGKELLLRIVSMLTRLIGRFEEAGRWADAPVDSRIQHEPT